MLQSALRQYRQQQRISALGVHQLRRVVNRGNGSRIAARLVGTYQLAAATLAINTAPDILAEQGIDTTQTARAIPASVLTGDGAAKLFDQTSTAQAFDQLVLTLIQDAGRTAASIDNATRPAVTGYVRSLNPPSCPRCAILAGRVYRYSQGFQRHPRCDCLMTPTDEANGKHLLTDPMQAFRDGQIGSYRRMPDGTRRFENSLSKADTAAVNSGANLGQVVNVRRKQAGLVEGSSVIARAGRLTPQGIFNLASDREQTLTLLRRYGYIT